jgi:hypothetical protein
MRSSACDTPSRFCARFVLCWPAFPSVPVLGSAGSEAHRCVSFVGFPATVAGSDFSCPFIAGYGSSPSRRDPTAFPPRMDKRSPGFRARSLSTCQGLRPRRAGPSYRNRDGPHRLPTQGRRRRPEQGNFRGSMAGLCLPLPTLRRRPRGRLRTARGRCGANLHRSGLSPHTPRRPPGAPLDFLRRIEPYQGLTPTPQAFFSLRRFPPERRPRAIAPSFLCSSLPGPPASLSKRRAGAAF